MNFPFKMDNTQEKAKKGTRRAKTVGTELRNFKVSNVIEEAIDKVTSVQNLTVDVERELAHLDEFPFESLRSYLKNASALLVKAKFEVLNLQR
jgi:hypothetical protein